MEMLIAVVFLAAVIGLAALPVWLVRRKKWKSVSKEERRAQTVTAIIILVILLLFAVIRQTSKQNAVDNVLEDSNTSQTAQ